MTRIACLAALALAACKGEAPAPIEEPIGIVLEADGAHLGLEVMLSARPSLPPETLVPDVASALGPARAACQAELAAWAASGGKASITLTFVLEGGRLRPGAEAASGAAACLRTALADRPVRAAGRHDLAIHLEPRAVR